MLTVYAAEVLGRRDVMQDATVINADLANGIGIFGVFDGHSAGGEQVAHELSDAIASIPLDGLTEVDNESTIQRVKETLHEVHQNSCSRRTGTPEQNGGSTALIAIIGSTATHTLWLGDGLIRFYPDGSDSQSLMVPHDGTNDSEIDRVTAMGEQVWRDERVKSTQLYRFGGGITLSRSIGHGEDMPFMSTEPGTMTIDRRDGLLILATDGVYNPAQEWSRVYDKDTDGITDLRLRAPIDFPIPLDNPYGSQATADYLVNIGAEITGDNASAVVIGLCPDPTSAK